MPAPADTNILFEDNHILVLNKPAGILVQSDYRDEASLQDFGKDYLKERYGKPGNVYLGIIHRLDERVSGAVIFAKTSKAAGRLAAQVRGRSMLKLYRACGLPRSAVNGLTPGTHEKAAFELLRIHDRSEVRSRPGGGAEHCEHDVYAIARGSRAVYCVIDLETGRKHQIRAWMAHRGIPVVGDRKYGSVEQLSGPGILLHAACLALMHPVKQEPLIVRAPLPHYFEKFLAADGISAEDAAGTEETLISDFFIAMKEN